MSACPIFFLLWLFAQASSPVEFSKLSQAADSARAANHLQEASSLYRQALALRPAWAAGWFSLGTLQYDTNDYSSAVASFSKVVKLESKSGTAQIMLGLCEFELGRDAPALQHLQSGRRIGSVDDAQLRNVALFHEGLLLRRTGQFQEAQQTLRSLCASGVRSDELLAALGSSALRLKDKTLSGPLIPQVGQAECLVGQKEFDDARRAYAAAIESAPEFPNIHYAFGRMLLDLHYVTEALAEFELEIKHHPDSALARLQIAAVKYKVDSAAGLPYAEDAVKLEPNLPLGHYILGRLLLDTGEIGRAISELETARRSLPKEAGVYYSLASAYARAGRRADAEAARADFKRLSETNLP